MYTHIQKHTYWYICVSIHIYTHIKSFFERFQNAKNKTNKPKKLSPIAIHDMLWVDPCFRPRSNTLLLLLICSRICS